MTIVRGTHLCFVAYVLVAAAGCYDTGGSDGDAGADGSSDTDTGTGGDWDPRFDPFVEALLADLSASDAYGVSAAIMENGTVTFAEAFGSKDPDGHEPLTPETLMQIGSTTKQMTATALLRQVEQGLVALDDTLEQTLPEFEFGLEASWDDQIAIRHMLSHQGGFFDTIPWDGSADDGQLAAWTYEVFDDEYFLMSPPGAFWNYSNPNFVLAGLVTETLDGRPWPDIMREDIFEPLGMHRTFARKSEVLADGDYALSWGYGVDDLQTGIVGPVDMEDVPDPAWTRPAGLVWTTPTQMMAWARFVMEGNDEVLSDELRAEITAEQVDTLYLVGNMHYGFGMFVERGYLTLDGTWYETPVWEHGGNTLSFSHLFYILPEHDFALAICSSGYATDFYRSVDAAITTLVDLPEPGDAPEYTIDPSQFDRHVATYADPWNVGEMIVTREGDDLLVEMPTLEAFGYDVSPQLLPISSEIFYLIIDGEPFDLTFIPLEEGGPSQWGRNRSFVVTRVDSAMRRGALARVPTPLDAARALERARPDVPPLDRILRASAAVALRRVGSGW